MRPSQPSSSLKSSSKLRKKIAGLDSDDEDEQPANSSSNPSRAALVTTEKLKEDIKKDGEIRSMEDLVKDLQPREEDFAKAMELASYMDREQAAEEAEAALVVQPKPVPKVSQTMASESTVREAGHPTCLTVRKPWIVIGMTHGVCLMFDKDQKLSGILGTQEGGSFGPVCSVAISNTSKMLVVGHESGAVVVWDISSPQKPLKTITDVHSAPVIHADFLKDDTAWVTGDIAGKMVHSTLTSMFITYYHSAVEIPNESGGCILALRALRPGALKDPSDALSPVAACTPLGTIIFSVFPKLHIYHTVPRPDDVNQGCIPYLSWREAVSTGGQGPVDPILALGWGTEIHLWSVRGYGTDLEVEELGSYRLKSEIIAVTWLGYNAIVILTALNEMQVFDPFSLQVLETSSLEGMQIAFHERLAAAYQAHEGCYSNAVVNQGDSGFVLGVSELYALRVLSWNDRLAALIADHKYLLALATCLETYQLKGKGYLGISADPERVRKVASDKIVVILDSYLSSILEVKGSSVHDRRMLASVCIRYLQGVGRESLLFDVIFPKFKSTGTTNEGIFLELIEPYILQDRIRCVNAETLRCLVEHYERHGWLRRVEQCILHLDVKTLDVGELAKICLSHNLASALIYVYNSGLNDYTTPLDHLFAALSGSKARATGLRILLYLSKCFTGQAFPTGTIPVERQLAVKERVMQYLFGKDTSPLMKLLQFDAKELFRVLSYVFDDANFADGTSITHASMLAHLDKLLLDPNIEPFKAYNVQKSRLNVTSAQLTAYFVFCARIYASGAITLSDAVFVRMLGHLCLDDDGSSRAARQTALLQMVKSSSPDRYNEKQLLDLAQTGEMFEVAELFYARQREYKKMVQCAIESAKYDKRHVFDVIGSLMSSGQLSEQEQQVVKKTTMNSLEQLIEVDGESASMLIIEHFAGEQYEKLVHELDSYPKLQYKMLRGIVTAQHNATGSSAAARWENILQDFRMTGELTEIYVKLLCKFAPEDVYPFLVKASDVDYVRVLEIVEPYNIEDANMFLLERTGDVDGAMKSVLSALDARVAEMKKSYLGSVDFSVEGGFPSTPEEKAVQGILSIAVGLCQRNSLEDKSAPENAQLWFQLLDRMVVPVAASKGGGRTVSSRRRGGDAAVRDSLPPSMIKTKQTMNFLMREVLRHMWAHVALPAILDKIVRDHARSEFSEFKDVIYNMLETFQYERSILGVANHVMEFDMYEATNQLRRRRMRPYAPRSAACRVCLEMFLDKPAGILVYSCGHAFHRTCLSKVTFCPICVTSKKKKTKTSEGHNLADSGADVRSRGKTMKEKAEDAKDEDGRSAQLGAMVGRYRSYLAATSEAEVPKMEILKVLEEGVDIFSQTGVKLTLAPTLRVEKKIARKEDPNMKPNAHFQKELTVEQAKFIFGGKKKKKAPASEEF